ncbi:MAG: LysR family transcriptional regulator [Pseudomonadota bacterium]
MDRLREMEVMAAIAEAPSFAEAGRRLRLSPAGVTRSVAALEERLGVRLVSRTTRAMQLTEAGRQFVAGARRALAAMEEAERAVAGETAEPRGHLRVTASFSLGRNVLTPVIDAFLAAHPDVSVEVVLSDRWVSLVEDGIDVGVRVGALPDSSLIARRVGTVCRYLVASPAYLARNPAPETPAALAGHALIGFTGLTPMRSLSFGTGETAQTVPFVPRIEVNDAVQALDLAKAGHGIAPALSYYVPDACAQGQLVSVLGDHAPPPVPVQLVTAEARLATPALRAFLDLARPMLSRALAPTAG